MTPTARSDSASLTAASTPAVPAIFRGRLKGLYPLYRSFELWSEADGLRMSAAMSFYGILSLAPLLVLIVAAIGWWLDREMLVSNLTDQIGAVVGARGAEVVRAALESAQEPKQGIFASVLAFGLLLMGATGVFAELQSAFERLWTQGSGVAAKDAWWHTATLRLRGVAYVLAIGFLMLVSLVVSSLLGMLEHWGGQRMGLQAFLAVVNQAVSLIIISGLFVALMRMSAGPQPRLRHLVVGAVVGAVLFGLGKYGLALYLSTAAVVSAYGAAGSLVVLLMWIYFASAILLYAASCARVLAEQQGEYSSAVVPPPAAAVTATARAERAERDIAGERAEVPSAAPVAPHVSAVFAPHSGGRRDMGPHDSNISPMTGVLAVLVAGAGYALTKRYGREPEGQPSIHAAAVPIAQVAERTRAPSQESPIRWPPTGKKRRRTSKSLSVMGAGLRGATFVARHIPVKWASWGMAAASLASKWRRKQAERDLNDALAAVQADVRALRRLSKRRRR